MILIIKRWYIIGVVRAYHTVLNISFNLKNNFKSIYVDEKYNIYVATNE